jgi:hypothetical protein
MVAHFRNAIKTIFQLPGKELDEEGLAMACLVATSDFYAGGRNEALVDILNVPHTWMYEFQLHLFYLPFRDLTFQNTSQRCMEQLRGGSQVCQRIMGNPKRTINSHPPFGYPNSKRKYPDVCM